MAQRKKGFADNYRTPLILAMLLIFSTIAKAQSFTTTSAWGYDWNAGKFRTLFAPPADTFAVPAAFQNLPFMARKAGRTYYWDITAHRWNTDTSSGSGGGGVDYLTKQNFSDTNTYDATRFWVLSQLSNYTPINRFLDSLAAQRTRFNIRIDSLGGKLALPSFENGLQYLAQTNKVIAQTNSAIWNAGYIANFPVSFSPLPNRFLMFDTTGGVSHYSWQRPDSANLAAIVDEVGWYAKGPYLRKISGGSGTVRNMDSAEVNEAALRALIESYQADGSVITGPDLSIDSVIVRGATPVTGGYQRTLYIYRSSGRVDSTQYIDYTSSGGPVYTTTDNVLNITGGVITTNKAWYTFTWASTLTIDPNTLKRLNYSVTLGGNTTINFSAAQDGEIVELELIQDVTGSRLVTWGSSVDWSRSTAGVAPTLKTSGGQFITFVYKSSTSKWYGIY